MPNALRILSNIEHLRHLVWEGWPELLPGTTSTSLSVQGSRTHQRATTETSSGAVASTTLLARFHRSTPSAHRWQRHRYENCFRDGHRLAEHFADHGPRDRHRYAQHRAGSLSFDRRGVMLFGCFYRCSPSVFLGFHVPGSSLDPASFVSTCFGLQRWLEVVAVEGFWFVKFARKGASFRSPTGRNHHRPGWLPPFRKGASYRTTIGCYHPLRGWSHPAKPGTNDPIGSLRSLIWETRVSESPMGIPRDAPSSCLNGSSCLLCQRREGVQGQVFDFGLLRFIEFVRDTFSAASRVGYTLATRLLHFPQDPDCYRDPPRATLRGSPGKRVSGRSVGLSFPRAQVRRHLHRQRPSTTSSAAERVGEHIEDQPVRERLSYQNVQARLGQGKRQGQVQGHLRAQAGLPMQARAGLSRGRDHLPGSHWDRFPQRRQGRWRRHARRDSDSFSSPYKGWPGVDEPMQVGRGPLRPGITVGRLFSHQGVGLTQEEGSPQTRPGPECQLASGNRPRHGALPIPHKCAHQKLLESPFDEHEVADLRKDTITILEQRGLVLERQASDRRDLPCRMQAFWACSGGFGGRGRRRHRVVRVGRGIGVGAPSQRRQQEQLGAATVEDVFRDTYRPTFDLEDAVKVVLKNQIAKRQAFYLSLDPVRRTLGKGSQWLLWER